LAFLELGHQFYYAALVQLGDFFGADEKLSLGWRRNNVHRSKQRVELWAIYSKKKKEKLSMTV
jgi:hypothetical protein